MGGKVCFADIAPRSVITTPGSWAASVIMLTLGVVLIAPVAICYNLIASRLLAVSLSASVSFAVTLIDQRAAARVKTKVFNHGCSPVW